MKLTIAANNVQVGDRIYNCHGYCHLDSVKWVRVVKVETTDKYTKIKTEVYDTWLHPRAGIIVERQS
jgi:hypothetical protein